MGRLCSRLPNTAAYFKILNKAFLGLNFRFLSPWVSEYPRFFASPRDRWYWEGRLYLFPALYILVDIRMLVSVFTVHCVHDTMYCHMYVIFTSHTCLPPPPNTAAHFQGSTRLNCLYIIINPWVRGRSHLEAVPPS